METCPLFTLYVVWHPSYTDGGGVADLLLRRFGRDLYKNVAGGPGLSVIYRSEKAPGKPIPLPVDWKEAQVNAVVVLVDSALINDSEWLGYVHELARNARTMEDYSAVLFPVTMESGCREGIQLDVHMLRWDSWEGSNTEKEQRLIINLTNEFSRMLRYRLDALRRSEVADDPLASYLEKIKVFISHSKHDEDGESIARNIRTWLHNHSALSSFFDVHDIPPGLPFKDVLLHGIGTSAVLVLHTDSYSSREWCRREVIEAKRHHVPMVVVDCLRDTDQRSIPYMGNVPIIRMNPNQQNRMDTVTVHLLDEVFRDFIWRCRVERVRETSPEVLFMAKPPELISLYMLSKPQREANSIIVYPEPLLGTDEANLFLRIVPNVRVLTLEKWVEESQ